MCKIPHITTLVILLFLCVGCKQATIDKEKEGYSEDFNQIIPDLALNIDEIFEIGLPDKSGFTPYASPDIVAKDEFEHSDYMLMVRKSKHSFTAEMIPIFSYAFLGEYTDSFEDGNEIYDKLDSIYSKQYPYIDLPETYFGVQNDKQQEEALKDYLFKRSIAFVSSDGKRVLCQSLLPGGVLTRTGLEGRVVEREAWNKLIEIYDGKESIYEKMYEDDDPNQSAPYIYDFFTNRSVFDMNGFIIENDIIINYFEQMENNINEDDDFVLHIPNTTNKFLQRSVSQNEISTYSLFDGKRLASINVPSNLVISQFTNDEKIVALFQLGIPNDGDELGAFYTEENIYSNDTYIMNIDGSDTKYLGDYMFNPQISPDEKHIAYTGLSGTDRHEYPNGFNNLADMKDGFYIKNLETNQTIFYPIENANEYSIVGWVSKKGLDNLLN